MTKNYFKNFLLSLTLFVLFIFPNISFNMSKADNNIILMDKNTRIEHLFTHCLIAHKEIAFLKGNEYGNHLDNDCITPFEFKNILNELYKNNYALIDINKTFKVENNIANKSSFYFPKNKKPLIFSFDDVVYAKKNLGKGMADKLILNDNGEILAYTQNQSPTIHKNEFIPILEDFIKEHPDFSFNNARGTIFLTGFNGILGYRTQSDSPNRQQEIKDVKPLISKLKESGWNFGCHSYTHSHMKKITPQKMEYDINKWRNEVEPLVGSTKIYAYPYGEWCLNDRKQEILVENGFKLFCGVGENIFYSKMPLGQTQNKILFQDRCPMDGISLRKGFLKRFLDIKKVYDPYRPIKLK